MEMIPVNSSNISAIGYSHENQILRIEFLNGRTYEYHAVPESEFNNLLNADSKGKYASQYIYKAYSQSEM